MCVCVCVCVREAEQKERESGVRVFFFFPRQAFFDIFRFSFVLWAIVMTELRDWRVWVSCALSVYMSVDRVFPFNQTKTESGEVKRSPQLSARRAHFAASAPFSFPPPHAPTHTHAPGSHTRHGDHPGPGPPLGQRAQRDAGRDQPGDADDVAAELAGVWGGWGSVCVCVSRALCTTDGGGAEAGRGRERFSTTTQSRRPRLTRSPPTPHPS